VIKSYDKLVKILDYVKQNPNVKLQDIADGLEMSKSTLHRIVMELVDYAFLSRDEERLTYKLGSRFLEYISTVIENLDIRTESSDIISQLNKATMETIHLAILVDDRIIYVDKRESLHSIRLYSVVGKEAPFYCTGVGKSIIAFQKTAVVDRFKSKYTFHNYTEQTITNYKDLEKEFAIIRSEGVAYDLEEHEKGVICIAAPIINHHGQVIASISITTITQRFSVAQLKRLKNDLIAAANTVSFRLGYRKEKRK
jgi:IclR family transcriptional regulator, KDG regulon repressor